MNADNARAPTPTCAMRWVAGGTFRMGVDNAYPAETPSHPVTVSGFAQRPYDGVSMIYSWDKPNAGALSARKSQYFEIFGNRAIYHEGWMANTVPAAPPWEGVNARVPTDVPSGYRWELLNLAEDPTQTNDLAAREPDRLRTMQDLWMIEATRNQGFPLNNSQVPVLTVERPGPAAGRTQFVYTTPMTSAQFGVAPSIINRSYRITTDIEVPQGGANGVLATQGGRFAGYALYHKDGKPTFTINLIGIERPKWQSTDALPPGKHTIVFEDSALHWGLGRDIRHRPRHRHIGGRC